MTEQTPENLADVPVQVVTLDHPLTAALFTEDENGELSGLYYNLGALVHTINDTAIAPRAVAAAITGSHDDKMRVEGAMFVLETIRKSGVAMLDEATAKREASADLPTADELAEMFNLGDE
jgi:hypothetical protein